MCCRLNCNQSVTSFKIDLSNIRFFTLALSNLASEDTPWKSQDSNPKRWHPRPTEVQPTSQPGTTADRPHRPRRREQRQRRQVPEIRDIPKKWQQTRKILPFTIFRYSQPRANDVVQRFECQYKTVSLLWQSFIQQGLQTFLNQLTVPAIEIYFSVVHTTTNQKIMKKKKIAHYLPSASYLLPFIKYLSKLYLRIQGWHTP